MSNIDVIAMMENATELFRLGKYKSKKFVEYHIGLAIHRSYFYGREDASSNVTPLKTNEVVFNSDTDVILYLEGPVVLPKIPVNNGSGGIVYEGYGLLVVDGVVVQDNRGGGGTGGGAVDSVNGEVGVVVLDTSNIAETTDKNYVTDDGLSTLSDVPNKVDRSDIPTKTAVGAIKADYDATTSTFEISIDGTDIL